jgi:hypothetical protein
MTTLEIPRMLAIDDLNEVWYHGDPKYEWDVDSVGEEEPGDRAALARIANEMNEQAKDWPDDGNEPVKITLSNNDWWFIYRFVSFDTQGQIEEIPQ